MAYEFPRTTVGGISVSRMIIGTNWMAGFSHRTSSADQMIKETHAKPDSMIPMLETFLANGVDTIMGCFTGCPTIVDAIHQTEQKVGKKIIIVDTPGINVEDSAAGRKEAMDKFKQSKALGADFCLIHHGSAELLVNKEKHEIRRLDDYTAMIRELGMVPGLSAHMPELITFSDEQGYDVETYIQIYNCMGFLMQIEIESVNRIIRNAKKPVMTIKPMAAGRTTPFVGLNFSYATIRDCDMVTVGCFNEREAAEDIEIARACLEGRAAKVQGRSSPDMKQVGMQQ